MANELQCDWTTGKTAYFLLRNAVGQIWNGATFVTYVTANLSTYAIAATEQGAASGYYLATMPTVAAGVYYPLAKNQTGGAPAESDLTVGSGEIQWGGSAVLPLNNVSLAASGLDAVLIESGIVASAALTNDVGTQLTAVNARQTLALILSDLLGLLSGAQSNNQLVKAVGSSIIRVNATTDSGDDRLAMTLQVPT